MRDGAELFGVGTELLDQSGRSERPSSRAPDGFVGLAQWDLFAFGGNEDGMIDARDAVWSRLLLWSDDGDAVGAPAELRPLASEDVTRIALGALKDGTRFGVNHAVLVSTARLSNGVEIPAVDIDFGRIRPTSPVDWYACEEAPMTGSSFVDFVYEQSIRYPSRSTSDIYGTHVEVADDVDIQIWTRKKESGAEWTPYSLGAGNDSVTLVYSYRGGRGGHALLQSHTKYVRSYYGGYTKRYGARCVVPSEAGTECTPHNRPYQRFYVYGRPVVFKVGTIATGCASFYLEAETSGYEIVGQVVARM